MTKILTKFLIIFAICIVLGLFVTGLVQSFILQKKQTQIYDMQSQITELEKENEAINSQDFKDAYARQEESKGSEDDIIYE